MTKELDLDDLRMRAGGDEALVRELVEAFVGQVSEIDALRVAIDARAFAQVEHLAHRLKGTLLALGAGIAGAAARAVEFEAARLAAAPADAHDLATLAAQVAELEARLEEARRAMHAFLGATAVTPNSSAG